MLQNVFKKTSNSMGNYLSFDPGKDKNIDTTLKN